MNMKGKLFAVLVCLLLAAGVAQGTQGDPDRTVLGDLGALAAAAELYRGEHGGRSVPTVSDLSAFLSSPATDDCRTMAVPDGWLVGRRIPEFSRLRAFLRGEAEARVFEADGMTPWLGGEFIWARVKDVRVANDAAGSSDSSSGGDVLLFSWDGSRFFWPSSLVLTPSARAAAVKKLGVAATSAAVLPSDSGSGQGLDLGSGSGSGSGSGKLSASPVELPPDISLRNDDEDDASLELGGIRWSPVPHQQ
ncbi:MAG: hypothetical protein LBR38_05050 [Synergistaceae bacterium]|jgi:hypothetical protein|nr:hypothetical protein [Synergistaceae bacterium]